MYAHSRFLASIASIIVCLQAGCDGGESANAADGGVASPAASANYAVGKITFPDGKPITGEVLDYQLSISGVSEAAERVSYSPAVTNGTYKQKLAGGQYVFNPAKIKVRYGQADFVLPLEPVGANWNKNRDAADGITQDFVWKVTGRAETYGANPDPNNATHWYGMSLGMRFATYREDKKTSAVAPPEGSKLTFTLTPTGKGIDGSELKPVVFERDWRPKDVTTNDDLNDFTPGNYEITGVCTLPDGSTKPIVFQGRGDYPNFVAKGNVPLEVDGLIGGKWKQLMSWGID